MLKSERERLRKVISEAVLLLCKNSCMVESLKVSIEGIIGITLGEEDVILVSFREEVRTEANEQSEKSKASHELVASKRTESDDRSRRHLTRRSKDCAITRIVTQAVESVEISETEERGSNTRAAKRKRVDSRSEENHLSRTSNQDLHRSSDKGQNLPTKPASDQTLDIPAKQYSNASVKAEIANILSEHLTESNEFSLEPSSGHSESTAVRETASDDSVSSVIPTNQPDIAEYDDALSSILKLPSELNHDVVASDHDVVASDPNVVVKCENRGGDDDCVFVKSEIFEVTDNQTSDMQMLGEEEFFGEGSLPFPDSGPLMQSIDQIPNMNPRYMEYIQRGCIQASTSQSVHTHISDDPSTYPFASSRHDVSLECHICKTVLKSRQTLNDHIQGTHLSRYRYKCTFCGQGFKWRSMLSYHKRACPALAKPGFC